MINVRHGVEVVLLSILVGICLLIVALYMLPGQDGPTARGGEGDGALRETQQASREARKRPSPPASSEFVQERKRAVKRQIVSPRDSRPRVRSRAVITAMESVPRHAFVPKKLREFAYRDSPLPIGYGQTISQPYIVATMSETLNLGENSKVLEIGTGSGYQAAVLAHLSSEIYTIEIIEPLYRRAKAALQEQGYDEVTCRKGDGYFGWKEKAPFDAIIVTCAAGHLPPPLWEQLKPGGRIIIPIGGPYEVQRLVLVRKTENGKKRSKTLMPVKFVPLTRAKDETETKDH